MTQERKDQLWVAFKNLGKEALYLSHYDLHERTGIAEPVEWKSFLFLPELIEYVRTEMEIIRKTAMNELLANAGDSNSVGKAQLLNAISKYDEENSGKEGPVFIYSYVPLNSQQEKAPNTRAETTDIFRRPPTNPFTRSE